MTTIAWDGYDLAADGQSTDTSTIVELDCKKIYDVGNGCFFGGAGNAKDCEIVATYLKNGEKKDEKPVVKDKKKDSDFIGMIVGPGGCNQIDRDLVPVPMNGPQAIGSGWLPALAAMKLGKTAKEAVELASKMDVYTGGKIQVIHINPRKGKK